MKIICIIALVTCGLPFWVDVETDGKLIQETASKYYVDFSESETAKKFCSGTLGKRLVEKTQCVILDESVQ